jgi:cell wall assembly regulator SMI1
MPMFDWLAERIAAARGRAREGEWRFVLNPPATEDAVRACEAALGLPLPPPHRAFLLRWDGAAFFRQAVASLDGRTHVVGGLEIAGTGALPALNARLRAERYEPAEAWGRLIMGGEAPVGEGDMWGLNPEATTDGEYAIVDGWHEQGPSRWRKAVVAPSFEDWLRRVEGAAIDTGEPYY